MSVRLYETDIEFWLAKSITFNSSSLPYQLPLDGTHLVAVRGLIH